MQRVKGKFSILLQMLSTDYLKLSLKAILPGLSLLCLKLTEVLPLFQMTLDQDFKISY